MFGYDVQFTNRLTGSFLRIGVARGPGGGTYPRGLGSQQKEGGEKEGKGGERKKKGGEKEVIGMAF